MPLATIDRMAELDYAFLADYAAVEGGKLNVMGASFTQVSVPRVPAQQQLYVAGRIRGSVNEPHVEVRLIITPPDDSFRLEGVMEISTGEHEPYFEDRVGVLFAIGLPIPFDSAGLYEVLIEVDEVESRTLKFEVRVED